MRVALIVQRGFTLIEVLLVMALLSVVGGLMTINLIQPQKTVSLDGTVAMVVADFKGQQIKAMGGESMSAGSSQPHGLYIQSGSYTLFKGATYSALDTDNYVVQMDDGTTLSTTLPSTQVVFTEGTGAVTGFSGSPTITVSAGGSSKVITINRHGVVSIN